MKVALGCLLPTAVAFQVIPASRRYSTALSAKIGVFFGTSTGSTEEVAEKIQAAFGDDIAEGPIDIDSIQGSVADEFAKHDALIVGTPTWNTGADTERSGTGWDEVYYGEMQDLSIEGKRVAVFGLGDSVSYSENYADASGELHDVFQSLGCQMMGYISVDGYQHEASKAQRGDKFIGLLLDAVNQEELTDERVENWVEQLKSEGILDGASAPVAAAVSAPSTAVPVGEKEVSEVSAAPNGNDIAEALARLEEENAKLKKLLQSQGAASSILPATHPINGESFTPYTNEKTAKTMWVSPDGRSCYYTAAAKGSSLTP